MILELKLDEQLINNFDFLLDKIESVELLELLKLDFQKRIKMAIAAFNMNEGYTIEDIKVPDYMEIFNVLQKNGNRYVCLIKAKYLKSLSSLAKKFNIDIIWDTPSIFTKDKMIVMDRYLFLLDRIRFEYMKRLGWLDSYPGEEFTLVEIVIKFDRLAPGIQAKPPVLSRDHPAYHKFCKMNLIEKEELIRKLIPQALKEIQDHSTTL